MRGQSGGSSRITLGTLLVLALPARGAGTHSIGGEGAVSNEMTWRQRRREEYKTLRPQRPASSPLLNPLPQAHPTHTEAGLSLTITQSLCH